LSGLGGRCLGGLSRCCSLRLFGRLGGPVDHANRTWDDDGEFNDICGGWVVAQAQVEAGFGRLRELERRADEAFGNCRGRSEGGVSSDGVDQVQVFTFQCAGGAGFGGALNVSEVRQANESDEWNPVSSGAIGRNGPEAQGAEGGGAKGVERVQGC